jgi:hypothetical protein
MTYNTGGYFVGDVASTCDTITWNDGTSWERLTCYIDYGQWTGFHPSGTRAALTRSPLYLFRAALRPSQPHLYVYMVAGAPMGDLYNLTWTTGTGFSAVS